MSPSPPVSCASVPSPVLPEPPLPSSLPPTRLTSSSSNTPSVFSTTPDQVQQSPLSRLVIVRKRKRRALVETIVFRRTLKRMQKHRLPRLQRGRRGRSQSTPSRSTRTRRPPLVSSCHQRSTRMICTTKVVKNQATTTTPRRLRRRHLSQEHPGRRRRR